MELVVWIDSLKNISFNSMRNCSLCRSMSGVAESRKKYVCKRLSRVQMEPSFVWHVIPRADVRAFFYPPATLFVALVLFSLSLSPPSFSLFLFPRAALRGWRVSRSSWQNQISVRCSRTKTEKFRKVCLKTNPFVFPLRRLPTVGLFPAIEDWWNRVAILRGRMKLRTWWL